MIIDDWTKVVVGMMHIWEELGGEIQENNYWMWCVIE